MDHTLWHCDFLKVKMNEKIRVRIPVRVANADICAGVKEGGTLQHFLRTVEVQCLPGAVPEHLDVDAEPLGIGASIHVSGLKVPAGVKITTDPMTVVVMVAEQIAEEVKPAEGTVVAAVSAEGAVPAEPEVLSAKKKEEGEEAPGTKPGAKSEAKGEAKKPAEKSEKK
jgi:large subunit ribosomal protein L25